MYQPKIFQKNMAWLKKHLWWENFLKHSPEICPFLDLWIIQAISNSIMLNPIITQRKNFLVYIISWFAFMILHFVIMYFFFDFSILIVVADVCIYTVLLFLLGIGVWYIVKYLTISDQSYPLILADHLVTGSIIMLM